MTLRRRWIFFALLIVLLIIIALVAWWMLRTPPMPTDLTPVEAPEGAQLLLFPLKNGWITAGYRNAAYVERNGYPHYGFDISAGGLNDVLASGDGVVLGTEFCDNSLGNIAVIRYDNVYIPETGEVISLIARYYHMLTSTLAEGDTVSAGQVMGTIDGGDKWYNHVHLELDTDLDYPFNTPQVAEVSSALLNRWPADGEGLREPMSILVADTGQHIAIHPNSPCCTDKDNPRYRVG